MKDSSVRPTKLMNISRCGKLLGSLRQRIDSTARRQRELSLKHARQGASVAATLNQQREELTVRCRAQRQEMLRHWDQSEEELTSQYERRAVAGRTELNRMAVLFRRKKADETKAVDRKVQSRRQAILQQFENRKNQPGQSQRKEVKRIDETLSPISQDVEWARALTIRRLDGLPEVGPPQADEEDFSVPPPDSVKQTISTITELNHKCKKVINEMQVGAASKIVDSFYLPAAVACFIVIWAVIAFLVAGENRYLWAAAGIVPAGLLGVGAYLILLMPLKKTTRQLYPKVERIARSAEQAANSGKTISQRIAAEASKELFQRRDEHIAAAERWQKEQLSEIEQRFASEEAENRKHLVEVLGIADQDYAQRIKQMTAEIGAKAETLAGKITEALSESDQAKKQRHANDTESQLLEHQNLLNRLKRGVSRGVDRMHATAQQVERDFPGWSQWLDVGTITPSHVDYLPLGSLAVGSHLKKMVASTSCKSDDSKDSNDSAKPNSSAKTNGELESLASPLPELPGITLELEIPESIPVVLHRRLHSSLVIQSDQPSMGQAIELAHQVLWRLLCRASPSNAKLTLIDPLGRGQHFTSFMALADHDPAIINQRVWTTGSKIEERLAELADHADDVLHSSLRDRFERIEDYHQMAGSTMQSYHAVAAVGFPDELTHQAYKHLQAVINGGLRCGIFTVLVCDAAKPWPSDMPVPAGDKVLSMRVDASSGWRVQAEGFDAYDFVPASAPPPSLRDALVKKMGSAAS